MQQEVTIVARMVTGEHIVEHTADFGTFVSLVLAFRRDDECVELTWHATPEPPEPVLYEHSGQAPWNQSTSLDFDLAEADYQRWMPVA